MLGRSDGDAGEDDHEGVEDVGDAKRFLETTVTVGGAGAFAFFEDFAGHIDELGLVGAGSNLEALGDAVAVGVGAGAGEIQVAENGVVFGVKHQGKGFFGGFGAVHMQAVTGKAFGKQPANAFFVVDHENGAVLEQVQGGSHHLARAGGIQFVGGMSGGCDADGREKNGEGSAACG